MCWVFPLSNLYYETPRWTQNAFLRFAKGSEDLESVRNTDLLRLTLLHSTPRSLPAQLPFIIEKHRWGYVR